MKIFLQYLKDYFSSTPLKKWMLTGLLAAVLIFINYTYGIEQPIKNISSWWLRLACFYGLYLFIFASAYCIQLPMEIKEKKGFALLFFSAPFFFALKMLHWNFAAFLPYDLPAYWKKYWMIVLQWPMKLLLLLLLLSFIDPRPSSWGIRAKHIDFRPYFFMLALMVPLIALASTQAHFLNAYPKLRNVAFITAHTHASWIWRLLYEISYGLDFISIEVFFRGLLVLGFVRFAGEAAILPMAAFYCSIHFGKPLAECISSYFGGLILGIIAYRTRSIAGGLLVHLGIAYLMELGGYLGNYYFNGR